MTVESQPDSYILTIRLIRSFECRNLRPFVVKVSDLNMPVKDLKKLIKEGRNFNHIQNSDENMI